MGPSAVAAACAAALLGPAHAPAIVSDVQPVDGPSADVVDVADAAMSEDGSGGLVYLKRVGGRAHVFAAQFSGGVWRAPQRVDVGQNFDSSWARIGAGDGGRLVVTWVQEFGVESDRMYSATLDPGASGFQAPVPIDFNVGEATSTFPDLAMSRGGQAYLTYRVITDISSANPPGTSAPTPGSPATTDASGRCSAPLSIAASARRCPSDEGNSPKVGIDVQGGAVVAWQEPDDEFVDRIWARRLFGGSAGIPLQVSPSSWEGAPLRGPADAFSLDVSGFGQAAVAFRQQPGQASKLDGVRVLVNETPDVFSELAGSSVRRILPTEGPWAGSARPASGSIRAASTSQASAPDPRHCSAKATTPPRCGSIASMKAAARSAGSPSSTMPRRAPPSRPGGSCGTASAWSGSRSAARTGSSSRPN